MRLGPHPPSRELWHNGRVIARGAPLLAAASLVAILPACAQEPGSPIDGSGGRDFDGDLGAAVREDSIAFDVDPREPLSLTLVVLRCSTSSDPPNFGFSYYANGEGRCARGAVAVPLAGELASTDVDVRVRYQCGAVVSDEVRPSLRKTGASRLDGEYSGTAPDCVGSGVETEWRAIYERRVPSHDLLFVWLAHWRASP